MSKDEVLYKLQTEMSIPYIYFKRGCTTYAVIVNDLVIYPTHYEHLISKDMIALFDGSKCLIDIPIDSIKSLDIVPVGLREEYLV